MKNVLKKLGYIIFIILCIFLYDRYLLYKKDLRHKNNETIVFLGDSLMARYDIDLYFKSFDIVNSGIGGNMTSDIINTLDDRVFKYNPKKVFIEEWDNRYL